jgi:hypothetical protein
MFAIIYSMWASVGRSFGLKYFESVPYPGTGNFWLDILYYSAIFFLNIHSALYNNIVGVVLNNYPLVHLISVFTSFVGIAATYVDKRMALIRGRMMNEEAMPKTQRICRRDRSALGMEVEREGDTMVCGSWRRARDPRWSLYLQAQDEAQSSAR